MPLLPAYLLALVYLAAAPAALTTLPTDVSAYTRGSAAVGFDPAAAGRLDGFELHLRQRSVSDLGNRDASGGNGRGWGSYALYGTVPLFGLTVFGGYEWGVLPDRHDGRGTFGLAAKLAENVFGGVSYHAVCPAGCVQSTAVWDLGLLVEPASYLSISAGIDNLNDAEAKQQGVALRAARLGVAVRPVHGQPWLTVAADSRLEGGYRTAWQLVDSRATLDVAPIEGFHVTASYSRRNRMNIYWGGIGFDLLGLELWGALRAGESSQAAVHQAVAVTLKSSPQESLWPASKKTIELNLDGNLEGESAGMLRASKQIPTATLDLDALAEHDEVGTVVLSLGKLNTGLATTDELRAAIARLREHGKRVVVDLRSADDKTYMVATAANELRLDPVASLSIDGFATTHHFFARALEHLHLRFDAVGIGMFKSGPDPFTRNEPRPQDAEVQDEIMQQAQKSLTAALAQDRHLSAKHIEGVLAQGQFDGKEAVQAGLVDRLYPNIELADRKQSTARLARLPQGAPMSSIMHPSQSWGRKKVISVVPIVGTIIHLAADNPLPTLSATSRGVVQQLQDAGADEQVVGVVLRIDSPGGDVIASEYIWRAVKDLAARKPVVVSMGDVAASGGYYVAAPAHAILAQTNTITGSIGIFTLKPDVSGLLDWAGISSHTYKSSPEADRGSLERPLDAGERQRLERSLESYYTAFVERVADGRHMTAKRVRELGEGRVYTGEHARRLGLVDDVGGLADAVRLVRQKANLSATQQVDVRVPDKMVGLSHLVESLALYSAGAGPISGKLMTEAWHGLDTLDHLHNRPLALWPGCWKAFIGQEAHP